MSNMVVRTNVMSLNAHRNLGLTGNMQARSAQRLSSGFRINSAADDAAGLGISEKMRAQIRGLDQASRNGQDGISLIQTAEGAMSTINEMVVRIRELVIQAANDTNAQDNTTAGTAFQGDRARIQDEINQLLEEIDATVLRTEFNTRTLLDGSLSAAGQPLLNAAQMNAVSTFMSDNFAHIARYDNAMINLDRANAFVDSLNAERAFLQNIETTVNTMTSVGALNTFFADAQLAWLAHTASDPALQTNLHAQADFLNARMRTHFGTLPNATPWIAAADLASGGSSGGSISGAIGTLNAGGGAQLTALRDAMVENRVTETAGGLWNVSWGSGATDNFDAALAVGTDQGPITRPPAGAAPANWLAVATRIGQLNTLIADNQVIAENHANRVTGERNAMNDRVNVNVNLLRAGIAAMGIDTFDALRAAFEYEGEDNSLWFQIGANHGQGVRLSIENVNVQALSDRAEAADSVTNGRNVGDLRNPNSEGGLGIMLENGDQIQDFVTALDAALAHVTAQRSNLGAMQNRLEFTIQNLDISSENLQAAESRIRDADMAREMMRFTQSNVLQQAAISMLAQANMAPQNILQLLG